MNDIHISCISQKPSYIAPKFPDSEFTLPIPPTTHRFPKCNLLTIQYLCLHLSTPPTLSLTTPLTSCYTYPLSRQERGASSPTPPSSPPKIHYTLIGTAKLNVFVERLWRSVKYEDVYLRAYETPTELRTGLARYFGFYNTKRRHSALDRRTPDAVYFDQTHRDLAA